VPKCPARIVLKQVAVGAKTFEELFAWQCCSELRNKVVAVCATPALQKDLEFRDQLRNAACGAPRLIAEGFGRFGHKEFRRYLSMARAELMEVQNDLNDLEARHLVTGECITDLKRLVDRALKITTLLRSSLND
jgi:four helix bundle protein